MDTKDAIQHIKDKYEGWEGYAQSQKEADKLWKECEEIIKLLEHLSAAQVEGEKYRAILNEFKKKLDFSPVKEYVKELEQKYFPEEDEHEKYIRERYYNEPVFDEPAPVKKVIQIEVEAKDEKSAKWAVDYITCDIKRDNWVEPSIKVKVNIKEG
jgi:hypothetical protein